jgi:5-methylcytosine-specific restriction endonuclease McrA
MLSVEEVRKLLDGGAEYSDAEIERIRDDVQVLAEISVESYLKQKNEKSFEYPEDEQFFASLLAGGSKEELREKFLHRFDFREPSLKRTVFDKLKRLVKEEMTQEGRVKCELHLVADCDSQNLVLDHIIPLSSNELNKHLRKITAPQGKKVPAQSFGANHRENFLVACAKCNNFKKHRFIKKEGSGWVIYSFKK